ncbi:VCBS repeat-containing protein [Marimonas arenosa]|uniref:VCBS repeat-containing protein n=1 Tax=Marimonas arenosa TaxID=1795305 RepID=A0AAE4B4I2_9RHOB|nr:VCBS repeat-containing protein [Marimonas arenosa]MDQ2091083.1 VCBS repeat-containing protein [Marimonas arenosa]
MRRAAGHLFACLAALFTAAPLAAADVITAARYLEPTTRYDHAVLGDAVEWGALELTVAGRRYVLRLAESRVFEDIAPRILPGGAAVVVVESDLRKGARLAIYGIAGLVAATPFIGQSHRWLAPVGAADLDGDGKIEIAYVDRPHLRKVLRIWRFDGEALHLVADLPGLTNHRIGWDFIPGGIRDCGRGLEMILADADWRDVIAIRWDGQSAQARRLGAYGGPESLDRALNCN